ncbi:MAG TPA: dihydroorotate dehydrogenase [Candidatus Cloacimonadota bacterium]|nr:dihydroorotate dehydrogenase [Candidatus Cloacimonadota bacterium]
MNRLSTQLGKLNLQNPVTVASGTFGTEYSAFYDLNILGAYVSKTITPEPKIGNPPPRLYETQAGMLNSIGLQNPGLNAFINENLPELKAQLSVPIIVSISAESTNLFAMMIRHLEASRMVDAYELNVSCPNVENEGIAFGQDPYVVMRLISELRPLTDKELIVKLSPNVTDIAKIAKAAESGGADSIALINTLFGMALDYQTGKSFIAKGICGYSGPAIKPIALANTWKVSQAVKIPILAMGGIITWQDALEFFYAGASAIALGTANFYNPKAVPDCLEGLNDFLEKHDLDLCDLIGKALIPA